MSQQNPAAKPTPCGYKIMLCRIKPIEPAGQRISSIKDLDCIHPTDVHPYGIEGVGHAGSLHRCDKSVLWLFQVNMENVLLEKFGLSRAWKMHSIDGPQTFSDEPDQYTLALTDCP